MMKSMVRRLLGVVLTGALCLFFAAAANETQPTLTEQQVLQAISEWRDNDAFVFLPETPQELRLPKTEKMDVVQLRNASFSDVDVQQFETEPDTGFANTRFTARVCNAYGVTAPIAVSASLIWSDETQKWSLWSVIYEYQEDAREALQALYYPLYYPTMERWNEFADVKKTDKFYDVIHIAAAAGFMNGSGDNLFQPNEPITRAMLVTTLYRTPDLQENDETPRFQDVPASAWFAKAAAWGQASGIISGYSDQTFRPHENASREQAAVILYRYAEACRPGAAFYLPQNPVSKTADAFADYGTVSDYAKTAVTWAVAAGLLSEKEDALLAPHQPVTRAELAMMITRVTEAILPYDWVEN